MVKVLSHDMLVKLPSWSSMTYATVSVPKEYAASSGSRTPWDENHPWFNENPAAIYAGATISSSMAFYDRERKKAESAVVIEDGETVEIGGKTYTVKVVGRNGGAYPVNCDPIEFVPSERK